MEKIEVRVQKPILDKLREMSDNLKISLEEMFNLSLIDGYSLYWFLYKKKILDLSDMPEEEFALKFHERYELLQEIETIESEFESKFPFGYFTNNYERYKKFLDFTNAFKSLKLIEKQEVKKGKEVPSSIPEARKVSKDKRKQKKVKQTVETPVKFLPKRQVPLILFSFLSTFLIFWLIRDSFNPIEIWSI